MSKTLILFHKLWTKAVSSARYDKTEWMQLEAILLDLERRKQERRRQ